MAIQQFSRSLYTLYEAARNCAPDVFSEEVVKAVGAVVRFDGALLGSGCASPGTDAGIEIDQAHVYNRCQSLAKDYATVSGIDPMAAGFLGGLHQPLIGDYDAGYRQPGLERLRTFASTHRLRKALVYGSKPGRAREVQWISLYRNSGDDFTEEDASVVHALWDHVTRATALNMEQALSPAEDANDAAARALVNARGVLKAVNTAMARLLKLEWHAFDAPGLPVAVVNALVGTGTYRGRKIEIAANQKFGYMACTARALPVVDGLARSELEVADRFAKGMTHSQIASHLKVSPNTVRNQLANVYQKLGIHSKVDLVRVMSGRRAP